MSKVVTRIFISIVILTVATPSAFCYLTRVMNYQGRLTNSSGTPLSGVHSVQFTIYDGLGAGHVKWQETQSVTSDLNGQFTVLLGSVSPIGDSVFTMVCFAFGCDSLRYLGIKVGTDPELTPRTLLAVVPFAYRVNSVDGALGGSIVSNLAINTFATDYANFDVLGYAKYTVNLDNTLGGDSVVSLNINSGASGPYNSTGLSSACTPSDGYGTAGYFLAGRQALEAVVNPTGNSFYTGLNAHLSSSGTGSSTAASCYASGSGYLTGVQGEVNGNGSNYIQGGVFRADNGSLNYGVYGLAGYGSHSYGVYGVADIGFTGDTAYGVYGYASPLFNGGVGWAGYFAGNTDVTGSFYAGAKFFKIDHPVDPEHKYLEHSCVESPDMMNIYNGNITTGSDGMATVVLPAYFSALNRDFRYQLTCIGQFAQAIVAEEINANQFVIKTDKPDVKVSWQVTGVRQDAYAKSLSYQVETAKTIGEVGKYLHPEAFGKGIEQSVGYGDYLASQIILKATEATRQANSVQRK